MTEKVVLKVPTTAEKVRALQVGQPVVLQVERRGQLQFMAFELE